MAAFDSGANCFIADPRLSKLFAPFPPTERGVPSYIGAHPREPRLIHPAGRNVVVRSLVDAGDCFIYRGHNAPVTVAKFSPNGYWVASADETGKVRVWSWDNPEHTLKVEVPVFSGKIIDLDWDSESKRIVAVGDGKTLSAKCFMWDTGNSVGEMIGHARRISTVSFKPNRPFRIMTGGEDFKTCFYKGPPFKIDHSDSSHGKEVWSVKFSPDGNKLVSVGADKKLVMYDSKEGTVTSQIADAHTGSILSCAFSNDSSKLLTAACDKQVKVWGEGSEPEVTYSFGTDVEDMQCAITSFTDGFVSLNLAGDLSVLDLANTAGPSRVFAGHRSGVGALAVAPGGWISGGDDGAVALWVDGNATKFASPSNPRKLHHGKVVGVSVVGETVVSAGFDDVIRFTPLDGASPPSEVSCNGQPTAMAVSEATGLIAVTTTNGMLQLFRNGEMLLEHSTGEPATAVAVLNDEELAVAVGQSIRIHSLDLGANSLTLAHTVEGHRGKVTCLEYSHDGAHLVAGDANREVKMWQRSDWTAKVSGKWVFHTTTVTGLAVSPSNQFVASGSLDESIFIWDSAKPMKKRQIKFAHKSGVTQVKFLDENTLLSAGNDGAIVVWDLTKE